MIGFVRTLRIVAVGMIALSAAAVAQDKPKEAPKPGAKQDAPKAGEGMPEMTPEQQKQMEAWIKYGTPGENHKLLTYMVGDWNYENKMWDCTGPADAPPQVSMGICTTRAIFDGRYFISEHSGDMMGQRFEGIATTAYDNHRKKFIGTWIDNMSTGIFHVEGTYDPSTKTFTYTGEMDDIVDNGPTIKVRETIKMIDKDTHVMTWHEVRDGKEKKAMEITYKRKA